LRIVRSMPVATCVVCVAVLFVSSASKMALDGSIVTVFVIGPTPGGATITNVIVFVVAGPRLPPEQVTTPAVMRGLQRAGRGRADFEVSCPVFVVTGEDEAQLTANAVATRKQIAFYGSTPAYRKVLDLHGWGDLHTELHQRSRAGDWDGMTTLIDDDVLAEFAVVAPLDQVAEALCARCDGVIDRVLPAFPAGLSEAAAGTVLADVRERSKALGDNVTPEHT